MPETPPCGRCPPSPCAQGERGRKVRVLSAAPLFNRIPYEMFAISAIFTITFSFIDWADHRYNQVVQVNSSLKAIAE